MGEMAGWIETWTGVCSILGGRIDSVWQAIDLGVKDDT